MPLRGTVYVFNVTNQNCDTILGRVKFSIEGQLTNSRFLTISLKSATGSTVPIVGVAGAADDCLAAVVVAVALPLPLGSAATPASDAAWDSVNQ